MTPRALPLFVTVAAITLFCSPASAEILELKSGGTLAGDVSLGKGDTLVVESRFPTVERLTLRREDLTAPSLYGVLERRADPVDAAARRELGALAAAAGLKGAAIAEFRAVAVLDPAATDEMEAKVADLTESLAGDRLQDARDLLQEGKANAALMNLYALVETYPGTMAAKEAGKLVAAAAKQADSSADVAKDRVDAGEAPGVIERIQGHLRNGVALMKQVAGHEGSVDDGRLLERAATHFEAAWGAARTLPVATGDDALDARIVATRKSAKTRLVQAYLASGTVHLQRRSLVEAERWCNRACELDPENKENHTLHRLILQAKAVSIGRGAGGGRVVVQDPDGSAGEATPMDPTPGYPLKTCVVSGDELDGMGGPVAIMYDGTEVQFCCKGCIKKFLADPLKYLPMVRDPKTPAGK